MILSSLSPPPPPAGNSLLIGVNIYLFKATALFWNQQQVDLPVMSRPYNSPYAAPSWPRCYCSLHDMWRIGFGFGLVPMPSRHQERPRRRVWCRTFWLGRNGHQGEGREGESGSDSKTVTSAFPVHQKLTSLSLTRCGGVLRAVVTALFGGAVSSLLVLLFMWCELESAGYIAGRTDGLVVNIMFRKAQQKTLLLDPPPPLVGLALERDKHRCLFSVKYVEKAFTARGVQTEF